MANTSAAAIWTNTSIRYGTSSESCAEANHVPALPVSRLMLSATVRRVRGRERPPPRRRLVGFVSVATSCVLESAHMARNLPLQASPSERSPSFRSVVHINEKGGRWGGTEEYLALLTGELARHDVRSHLVCGWAGDVSAVEWTSVHVVPTLASRSLVPGTGQQVGALVAGLDADVVYLHNVFDPAVVTALARCERRGALLWYVHDHFVTCLTELRWRSDVGSCPVRLGRGCLDALDQRLCTRRHEDRTFDESVLADRQRLSHALGEVDSVVVVSEYMRGVLAHAEPAATARIHLLERPIRDVGERRQAARLRSDDPATGDVRRAHRPGEGPPRVDRGTWRTRRTWRTGRVATLAAVHRRSR